MSTSYECYRHSTNRICDETGCEIALPPWDQHPLVFCNRHMKCTLEAEERRW